MNKLRWLLLIVFISFPASAPGQHPVASPLPQRKTPVEEDVVRITTNLVQVDALVTDRSGKQVTDLRSEDFEILEDGKPQKITHFSYVSGGSPGVSQQSSGKPAGNNVGPTVPLPLRPDQVKRTVAIVVDDLGLSFESTAYVRSALKKFIEQQMEPGDLVAIIRTSAGIGALQQFTSDKRQLYAAVQRVKWNPIGRAGISAFGFIGSGAQLDSLAGSSNSRPGMGSNMNGNLSRSESELNEFREDVYAVGTLGAINFVIKGLKELPGRKSVLLISDGFPVYRTNGPFGSRRDMNERGSGSIEPSSRVVDSMQRLIDLANRSSVVIYTIDPRGLQFLGLTAADNTSNLSPDQINNQILDRQAQFRESQTGLAILAKETGGFSVFNNNDVVGSLKRVIEDQRGYYLIGYRPSESTFDPKTRRVRFHTLSVKVKSTKLNVRYRHGFLGITDEDAHSNPRTSEEQLVSALTSPFNSGGVHLRLTALFSNNQKTGSFVRSLLNIEARDLTFKEDKDGWQRANFDVVAITFGDNGRIVDQISKNYRLGVRGEAYRQILRDGLLYNFFVPVKKPGAYQLRTALRDTASANVGSASQFIEVPDLGKDRLTLSGVVVNGVEPAAFNKSPSNAVKPDGGNSQHSENGDDNASAAQDELTGPAIRHFKPGSVLQYQYLIFNAKLNTARQPMLQTQVRMFLDGKEVFHTEPSAFDASNQPDLKRLVKYGAIRLGSAMQAGEYVLQVLVTDSLAKEKYRTSTQWIDFEIVK